MAGQFLAYAFKSNLTLNDMLEKLNATTPWKWVGAQKDDLGEYLAARPFKAYSKFRIFTEKEGYLFDIYYTYIDHGAEDAWETHHSMILNEILPTLGARDVKPAENVG